MLTVGFTSQTPSAALFFTTLGSTGSAYAQIDAFTVAKTNTKVEDVKCDLSTKTFFYYLSDTSSPATFYFGISSSNTFSYYAVTPPGVNAIKFLDMAEASDSRNAYYLVYYVNTRDIVIFYSYTDSTTP